MRAKRAIPAAQSPRRVARLAQILRYAKNALLRMTSKFSHYTLGRSIDGLPPRVPWNFLAGRLTTSGPQ